jgi:hypothetical protein
MVHRSGKMEKTSKGHFYPRSKFDWTTVRHSIHSGVQNERKTKTLNLQLQVVIFDGFKVTISSLVTEYQFFFVLPNKQIVR